MRRGNPPPLLKYYLIHHYVVKEVQMKEALTILGVLFLAFGVTKVIIALIQKRGSRHE